MHRIIMLIGLFFFIGGFMSGCATTDPVAGKLQYIYEASGKIVDQHNDKKFLKRRIDCYRECEQHVLDCNTPEGQIFADHCLEKAGYKRAI